MRTIAQCQLALDMMCERALSRESHGKVIAEHQMVQAMVADGVPRADAESRVRELAGLSLSPLADFTSAAAGEGGRAAARPGPARADPGPGTTAGTSALPPWLHSRWLLGASGAVAALVVAAPGWGSCSTTLPTNCASSSIPGS